MQQQRPTVECPRYLAPRVHILALSLVFANLDKSLSSRPLKRQVNLMERSLVISSDGILWPSWITLKLYIFVQQTIHRYSCSIF